MPVPSTINDLSTVAGSNSPAGTDTPQEGDNYIRALSAFIAQVRDAVLSGTSSSITLNLTVKGNTILGDAASDTLTINPNAVTWAGTPVTHSGSHIFATLAGTPNASEGLKVGNAAQAGSDILDWYQEGTFTPVATGSGVSGAGTYTSQIGRYTRIGRLVFFAIDIAWSAHTGTLTLTISGLPFQIGQTLFTATAIPTHGPGGSPSAWYPLLTSGNSSFGIQGISFGTGVVTSAQVSSPSGWRIHGFYEV